MGFLKKLATGFVWICTFLAAITFIPGLPPNVDFNPYEFKLPASIDGVNYNLNEAELLFKGEIKGPESFDIYDGVLYTTLHGGAVSKLVGNKLVQVVKFGKKCDGLWEEEKCGRPLGLKFDKKGKLYVVDAYYGIFKVDVKTGKYEKIVDISKPIDKKVPMFTNAIDVASNGDVYWTESSSSYKLYDGVFVALSDPEGRLIRYNAATKKNEVLLDNLGLANGIKLSDDESYVLVAETMTSRIIKYHIKGAKAGKHEVFIEGLPGVPDNIHSDGQGNFLIALVTSVDEENPMISQSLAPHSNLRKMCARFLSLIELPFKYLELAYPNYYTKRIVHWIGHFESMRAFTPPHSTILRVDKNGKVLNVLSSSNERVSAISSAIPHDGYLYLGSPFNEYLARVLVDKVLPGLKTEQKASKVPVSAEKPVVKPTEKSTVKPTTTTTTTPRPTTTTTTTPRPTTTTTTTPKPTTTTTPKPTTTTTTPRPTTTTTTPRPTTTTTPKPTTQQPKPQSKHSDELPKPIHEKPKAKVEQVKKPAVKPVREEVVEDKPQKTQKVHDEM